MLPYESETLKEAGTLHLEETMARFRSDDIYRS